LVWLGVYLAVQVPRYSLVRAFRRRVHDEMDVLPWGRRFSVLTAITGLVWGLSGVLIFPADSTAHQVLLAISVAGVSAAAAAVYSPVTECYLPTILAMLLPLSARYFYEGDEVNIIMGAVILIFGIVLVFTARKMHEVNSHSLMLGFENNDLIGNLRAEIDERNRAEQALAKSEQRLELALNGADLGLWDWNIDKNELFLDPKWLQTLGYSADDIQIPTSWWRKLIHPDDKSAVDSAMDGHLNGSRPFYEAEFRLLSKAGDWKWVLSRGKVVERDPNGNPSRVTGTSLDITDRKAAEDQIRGSLKEKEVLLREIHHRVKNNLQVMSSLLRLQSRYVKDDGYREMFRESVNRVHSMALVHEKLYQSQNLAEIRINDYLAAVTKQLMGAYESVQGRVALGIEVQPLSLGIETAMPLGFIVTELLSNALKHAFPGTREGKVTISPCRTNGDLDLVISDNGIGMPAEFPLKHPQSLGLRLVAIFVDQLQGETELTGNPGTRVRITFKASNYRERSGDV
jgi:PAS domain S-box-containing protein